MSDPAQHDGEGYTGPAELVLGDRALPVSVDLRGGFQPIDGLFHWWGRVGADSAVDDLVPAGGAVGLRTAYGEAAGRLSDRDTWGRYRITGLGRPPFPA